MIPFHSEHDHWQDEQSCDETQALNFLFSRLGFQPDDVQTILTSVVMSRVEDILDEYLLRVQDEVDTLNRWHNLPS